MRSEILFFLGLLIASSACSHAKKQNMAISSPPAVPTVSAQTPVAPKLETPAKKEDLKQMISCKRDKEIRTIEIEPQTPKGCHVWYSKNGSRNTIASSKLGNSHCENIQSRIKSNLEEAKFTCTAGSISQPPSTVVQAVPPTTQSVQQSTVKSAAQSQSPKSVAPTSEAKSSTNN